jgi:transcriptional/translational regulatory protein YebC/TACO1
MAVVIDAATDNRNRTAADLRTLFSRNGGSLGESGSVAWNFEPRGLLEVETAKRSEDALTEAALVDGVVDVRFGEETSEIVTEAAALGAVREALGAVGFKVTSMVLGVVAKTSVALAGDDAAAALGLLEALEDHEDVQQVYANVTFDEAKLEALA